MYLVCSGGLGVHLVGTGWLGVHLVCTGGLGIHLVSTGVGWVCIWCVLGGLVCIWHVVNIWHTHSVYWGGWASTWYVGELVYTWEAVTVQEGSGQRMVR